MTLAAVAASVILGLCILTLGVLAWQAGSDRNDPRNRR